jgi:hypothetical protein
MRNQQNILLLSLLLSIILLGQVASSPSHQKSAYASGPLRPTDGRLEYSVNVINDNGGNKTSSDLL